MVFWAVFLCQLYTLRGDDDKKNEIIHMETLYKNVHEIGSLYDAQKQEFKSTGNLWDVSTVQKLRKEKKLYHQQMESSNIEIYTSNDVWNRIAVLNVDASMALSVLGGNLEIDGTGKFLTDIKTDTKSAVVSLKYRSTRYVESIPFETDIQKVIGKCQKAVENGNTHVLTAKLVGTAAIFKFTQTYTDDNNVRDIEGNLHVQVKNVSDKFNLTADADLKFTDEQLKNIKNISLEFYSNSVDIGIAKDYESAIRGLIKVQNEAKESTSPLRYQLTPLEHICSGSVKVAQEMRKSIALEAVNIYKNLESDSKIIDNLLDTDVAKKFETIKDTLNTFKEKLDKYKGSDDGFAGKVRYMMQAIRSGTATETQFSNLLTDHLTQPFVHERVRTFLELREREISSLRLIMKAVNKVEFVKLYDTLSEAKQASDCNKDYSYALFINVLAEDHDKLVDQFVDGNANDEAGAWYRDLKKVGFVANTVKNFLDFAKRSQTKKHCFRVTIKERNKTSDNLKDLIKTKYVFQNFQGKHHESNEDKMWTVPLTPQTPICKTVEENDMPTWPKIKVHLEQAGYEYNEITKPNTLWVVFNDVESKSKGWTFLKTPQETSYVFAQYPGKYSRGTVWYLKPNTVYKVFSTIQAVGIQEDSESSIHREAQLILESGYSPNSETITYITPPSTKVQSFRVEKATYESISLKWEEPKKKSMADKWYLITLQDSENNEEPPTIVKVNWAKSETTVINLTPSTVYKISIQTETKVSRSSPVYVTQATAPKYIPVPEIQDLTRDSVTILVRKSLINLATGVNAIKLHAVYKKMQQYEEHDNIKSENANGPDDHPETLTLQNLDADRDYRIEKVQLWTKDSRTGIIMKSDAVGLPMTISFSGSKLEVQLKSFIVTVVSDAKKLQGFNGNYSINVTDLVERVQNIKEKNEKKTKTLKSKAESLLENQESILTGVLQSYCKEHNTREQEGTLVADKSLSSYDCLDDCKGNCESVSWIEGGWELYKRDVECASVDVNISPKYSVSECAKACLEKQPQFNMFIYGRDNSDRKNKCFCEKSKDTCKDTEPKQNLYDLYKIITPDCKGRPNRRGNVKVVQDKLYFTLNKPCYESMSRYLSRWEGCLKEKRKAVTNNVGYQIAVTVDTVEDCFIKCLNTDNCKFINFKRTESKCIYTTHTEAVTPTYDEDEEFDSVELSCMTSDDPVKDDDAHEDVCPV